MLTNFYPINFPFENYNLQRVKNQENLLQKLKTDHNSTHSFIKLGDYIYISNKCGDDLPVGETVNVSIHDDADITSALIKHIFFRTFRERNPHITPISFYPFRIESIKDKDDLVYERLPDDLKGKITYKKQVEIQVRQIETNGKSQFGFVINTPRKWSFNINCLELQSLGFDCVGSEVLYSEILPGLDNVIAPLESLIGILKEIRDEKGIVDTNDGEQEYELSALFLKKTSKNIRSFLEFRIGVQASDNIFDWIKIKKEEFLNLKSIHKEIQVMATWICKDEDQPVLYQNKDGFCFSVKADSNLVDNGINLLAPTFIYNPARTQTYHSQDIGLIKYGPYDSSRFPLKTPKILAICQKQTRGDFTRYLKSLIDGIPNSTFFTKGLKNKYELHDINYEVKEVIDYGFDFYDKIIRELEEKPHLVLIEIDSECRNWDMEKNPYYYLKARFFSMGIPVQFVTTSNVRYPNEYKINAIALQIYAKLGGIPFVLEADETVDRELIIGIGHTVIRNNAFKGNLQDRVVGITTFFSGDGQYLLANKAKDVSYDDYFNELLQSLRKIFDKLIEEQAWKKGETVRLIFHIFKPIKNIEFDVIQSLISEYSNYSINFAFVTISRKHPFLLFDSNQKGRKKNNSEEFLGEFVPQRGVNIKLNDSSCLIQMLGVDEMKTNKHGSSHPLLISLRLPEGNYDYNKIKPLLFEDLPYIVQQIYKFTYLSWRGFLKSEEPATMKYANLIAGLLGKLRRIDFWQSEVINLHLKHTKWFL